MVRKLNKYSLILITFLAVGCSGSKEGLDEKAPDVVFGDSQNAQISFDEFVSNARFLYEKKDYPKLESYVNQYKNQFTQDLQKKQIAILNALVAMGKKDLKAARSAFTNLMQDADSNIKGQSLFYEGDVERLSKNNEKALELYNKAYSLLKLNEINSSIADTYSQMHNWDLAATYYKKVIEKDPAAAQDVYYLGMVYFEQNKWEESKKTFNRVLEINPKSANSYHMLALIAQKQGDIKNYYYNLSREMLLKRQYQPVAEMLLDKKEIYSDIRLFKILISSYVRLGKVEDAKIVLQKGLTQNPTYANDINVKIYKGSFIILPTQGKLVGLSYFQGLYKQYPNNVDVITAYASFIEKDPKRQRELESLYIKILDLEEDNVESRYKLSNLYEQSNRHDLAQMQFGILYYFQNEKDQALEALLKLKEFYPHFKNSEADYYTALIYDDMGDKVNAKKYYELSLSEHSTNKAKKKLLLLENKK